MTKFFIDQHGCAKNQVDGELICTRLTECGYTQIFDAAQADIIIINSCGFIESAKKESLDAVYAAKKQNPHAKILLAGCLAERYASVFENELPEADAIFGNGDVSRIDEVVSDLLAMPRPVLKPKQMGVCAGERTNFLSYRGAAFVKVTEGCDNRCTFCAIPIIRGNLRSRGEDEIVAEIEKLVAQGFYEINLIGQDLAAYGTGENDLPGRSLTHLLDLISQVAGDFRVRLLYIHPDHFNRGILPVMQRDRRIVPYFDIPFQSGSDTIICAMNRKGTAAEYKRLVDDIRAVFPDAAIRTTFLAGFPGETDDDAKATREFLCSIESDWSGCFTYSREEDTPAYNMKKRVPAKVAKARADELQKLQAEITARRLQMRIGKEYDVLVEEVVDAADGGTSADSGAASASAGAGASGASADSGAASASAGAGASGASADSEVRFAIARAWFQAPEVDGSVVVRYDADDEAAVASVKPGNVVRVFADRVNGVDIDARFVRPVTTRVLAEKTANREGGELAEAASVSASETADSGNRLIFAPEESE